MVRLRMRSVLSLVRTTSFMRLGDCRATGFPFAVSSELDTSNAAAMQRLSSD